MKALKILALAMALMLTFSACSKGETKGETADPNNAQNVSADLTEDSGALEGKSEESEPKEEKNGTDGIKEENAEKTDGDKLYYCTDTEGELNVTYHTEDCELLRGKQTMEITSDFVTMIGLKKCDSCNPPEFKN